MTVAHGLVVPGEVWTAWSWDPSVIAALLVAGLAYGFGLRRLPAAARKGLGRSRIVSFYAALAVLGVALLSPLDAMGETLFSVHMVQHLTLIFVAAPLLAHGLTSTPWLVLVPRRFRATAHALRRSRPVLVGRRVLTAAAVAVGLHALALWAWHLPYPYEIALESRVLHAAEHVSFLLTAVLFWMVVMGSSARRRSYGVAILCVFVTAMQSGALGALLTFASRPLYSTHILGARAWGFTAMADQQLAGVVMWVPAGFVYLVVMAALFLRWLNLMDQRMRAAEVNPIAGAGRR